MIRVAAQLLLLFLAQSRVPREVLQLATIQRDVTADLAKLPDYMCTETIERSSGRNGGLKMRLLDTVILDVAFIGGKEVYGKHGAESIDKNSPGELVRWGVTSNGEFAGFAHTVFGSRSATTRYAGAESLERHAALRWDFMIPYLSSGWTLLYAGQRTKVSSKGSFWVDASDLQLMRLEVDATEIDPDFSIIAAHIVINYDRVRLGERRSLIPVRTELVLHEKNWTLNRNIARFDHCKEYRTESGITFDSDSTPKK